MKKFYMLILLLVLLALFWFSDQNGQVSTSQSDGVLEELKIQTSTYQEHRMYTLIIRKTAHVSIYFIIGILIYLITENPKYVLIGVFLIACSDELHQLMVAGRSGKILDVFIDLFGGILSIGAYKLTQNMKKKLTSN